MIFPGMAIGFGKMSKCEKVITRVAGSPTSTIIIICITLSIENMLKTQHPEQRADISRRPPKDLKRIGKYHFNKNVF